VGRRHVLSCRCLFLEIGCLGLSGAASRQICNQLVCEEGGRRVERGVIDVPDRYWDGQCWVGQGTRAVIGS
jgi:hypothetical protein